MFAWVRRFLSKKNKLVLVIEDDPEIGFLLMRFLTAKGCKVKLAKTGQEGLDTAQKILPTLILLDIMLPEMDGFDVLMNLKSNAETKDIPVIMCTSMNKVTDVERCCKFGAEGYITKPFEFSRVWGKINLYLHIPE